jgi:hypothetical protein
MKIKNITKSNAESLFFHYSYHDIIVDNGKIYNFKIEKRIHFLGKKNYLFLSMWKLNLGYCNTVHAPDFWAISGSCT